MQQTISYKKRKKRPFRKLLLKVFSLVPKFFRYYLIRRFVTLPLKISSETVFKVADSVAELESAFALVYKDYVKLGYCSPTPNELRGTRYHALPSTATLIAKNKNETVGTLTIVRDNSTFTLPVESAFDLKPLRFGGHRIAEITSMVIHPDFRRIQGGQILFPLMKLMYHYCSDSFGVNRLVIAISPKDEDFYSALLCFKRAPQTGIKMYLGAPAVVMYLDLDVAANDFYEIYNDQKPERNLYHFFKEWQTEAIQIKSKELFVIENRILTQSAYLELFVKKLNLSHESLDLIYFPERRKNNNIPPRVKTDAPAIFTFLDHSIKSVQVKNISLDGFQTKYLDYVNPGQMIEFKIFLKSADATPVKAVLVWKDDHLGCGWKILDRSIEWQKLFFQYTQQPESFI